MKRTALSVNLNKIALVRNTRVLGIPSLKRAAEICLRSGVNGITVHPRPDQRHIRPHDVYDLSELLARWVGREFNIEGNPFQNLMDFVRVLRPHQCTLVPDCEGQLTSDHGWNFLQDGERLRPLIAEAQGLGVRVSLFKDVEPAGRTGVKALGADRVELYTGPYAQAWGGSDQRRETTRYAVAARTALDAGLGVNAGHDLNRDNLTSFLKSVPGVQEVSIGRALISDALELGYAGAVAAYLRFIQEASAPSMETGVQQ